MPRSLRRALAPVSLLALAATAACASASGTAAPAPVAAPARDPVARLAAALDSVFNDPAFARAHWGVLVRSEDRGEVLYRRNAERMFVPGSNLKVVTAAAALEVLGPEFRYRTTVAATGPVRDGVLRGDLVVVGGGDPTLSARFFGTPTAVFEAWADSLQRLGVRRIEGRVVGNDDVFDDVPLGRGWAWNGLDADYAAEISGLELNEGAAAVRVEPGARPGEPARASYFPALPGLPLANRAVTGAPGQPAQLFFAKAPAGTGAVVWGTIPAGGGAQNETVAIRDNTLALATVLREVLRGRGIEVSGGATDLDLLSGADSAAVAAARPLFVHVSAPLREVMPGFLKPSQNQIAEILLKTLGRVRRGEGSAAAGIAVVDSLVGAWGLDRGALAQADGSGLSRSDLVAPELLAGVLERMERGPNATLWRASLPVMGVDGTLATRQRGGPLEGRVVAKTGTLFAVRALSGYTTTADGERIVFSMLANGQTLPPREVDRVVDAALLRVVSFSRGGAAGR
jgi:D-alanyl-D-alanine carboxypeptidase/D-alanyl-D-alanine-endopeptidase (penicillin-binding protein 4)